MDNISNISDLVATLDFSQEVDLEGDLKPDLRAILPFKLDFEAKPLDLDDFGDKEEMDFDLRWNANLEWVKRQKFEAQKDNITKKEDLK